MEENKKINEFKEFLKETRVSLTVEKWGLGLLLTLGFILIVLQLTNVINISWWVILAPFYIPAIITLAIALVICCAISKVKDVQEELPDIVDEKPVQEVKPIEEPKEEPKKKTVKKVKKNVKKVEPKNVEGDKGDTTDNK